MNQDQQQFFDEFMDNFNTKYPVRYKEGVKKYNSVIHKDYTIEQHIENAEQELFDGLAYVHALKYLVADLRKQLADLEKHNRILARRVMELEHGTH